MGKTGWLDRAIAPLTWLERARGWRRRALVFLYLTIALVGAVFGWRELSLWRLPDAPEPFDLARFGRVEVSEADNAIPLYRAATNWIKPGQGDHLYKPATAGAWEVTDWAAADPEVRRWAEDSRPALEPWLQATRRPEALVVQPEEMRIMTSLTVVQTIRHASRVGLLEGSRREQAGDLAGAWELYNATLRSSRHVGRHGGLIQRLIGWNILDRSRARVATWTENPAVTSDMLRRAIADVAAAGALSAPASDMIQVEYFADRDVLAHPETWDRYDVEFLSDDQAWYNHIGLFRDARRFLRREPERSRRVLRLIVAGHLAQVERPQALRPKLRFEIFMIYDIDPRTPPALRLLTPEELNAWVMSSAAKWFGSFRQVQPLVDAEPGIFELLQLKMAERAYRLDRGRPPKTFADLLGTYLKTLPEGIEPGDPLSAAP